MKQEQVNNKNYNFETRYSYNTKVIIIKGLYSGLTGVVIDAELKNDEVIYKVMIQIGEKDNVINKTLELSEEFITRRKSFINFKVIH